MLKILGRKNSSNVQKVAWACDEIGLAFEREDVGGPFGRNKDPEYLVLNPNGTVPTVIDDGFVLWESNAIVRYLAGKHGVGKICPENPQERALADQWMDWQQTTAMPPLSPIFYNLIRMKPEERDMNLVKASRDKLSQALAILDRHLAKNDFVAGRRFSMGDIPLGILVYRWFTLQIEREDYPALKAWHDRLAARPAFKTHVMIGLS
ncbi:MAG: glutathione S-transferase family protein [Alphaproteobacteria bacterium]|nr:glutathione S-transferase family protein [Alphaproteobacteria bacterium]